VWLAHRSSRNTLTSLGHLLPYWEGVAVDTAVSYSLAQFKRLQQVFPAQADRGGGDRLAEPRPHARVGGRLRLQRALFLRRFLRRAEQEQMIYYVMEAFDQPWKAYMEGAVGSVLGSVRREPAPEVRLHRADRARAGVAHSRGGCRWRWRCWCWTALISTAMPAHRGRSFLAVVVYATATIAVWVIYDFTQQ